VGVYLASMMYDKLCLKSVEMGDGNPPVVVGEVVGGDVVRENARLRRMEQGVEVVDGVEV
jgi:hypothetical protein